MTPQTGSARDAVVGAPSRDIVVIGASAGGVEALAHLVERLPADLPAAIFVVLHVPPASPSSLPAILARAGTLPAAHATDGERIEHGRLYIAPPDRHMLVRRGYVALTRGPRENRLRPAADPLFRSAARAYGPRVAGVVLSGTMDDGSLGLRAIAAHGGVTIVQDPTEALFDGMPRAALRQARIEYTLAVDDIALVLARLARGADEDEAERGGAMVNAINDRDDDEVARDVIRRDMRAQARDERSAATTVYTCPECGGTLWQVDHTGATRFYCHVGHSYGAEALLGQMSEELEAALWRAVRLLEEKATLTRQLGGR
ncbi:MAG: chemotaxis protein CheB, partial [Chloroflexi bacterium]|nr:chemotaxis protein CheB [Chloroflexota bacterium]